jgi:hypothetical protein
MRHLRIDPELSRRLGQCGRNRDGQDSLAPQQPCASQFSPHLLCLSHLLCPVTRRQVGGTIRLVSKGSRGREEGLVPTLETPRD